MLTTQEREIKRRFRHERIRKKMFGTPERMRLCVHRSLRNFSAQVIDDQAGKVIFGLSTLSKEFRKKVKDGGNVDAAGKFGEFFAQEALKKGVKRISFDRGGYIYHGRVKAFADALRQAGLEF